MLNLWVWVQLQLRYIFNSLSFAPLHSEAQTAHTTQQHHNSSSLQIELNWREWGRWGGRGNECIGNTCTTLTRERRQNSRKAELHTHTLGPIFDQGSLTSTRCSTFKKCAAISDVSTVYIYILYIYISVHCTCTWIVYTDRRQMWAS